MQKTVCMMILGCLIMLSIEGGRCATIRVPQNYKTISQAINNAQSSDTIVITDSGVYKEELVIDKPLKIEAAIGQTPRIKWNELSKTMITFGPGSQNTHLGSESGGRIYLDGNKETTKTLEYMIDFRHGANNNVVLENLEISTSNSPNCEIYYCKDDNNFEFKSCIMDGNEKTDKLMQVLGKAKGKYLFERCLIKNFVNYGIYFESAEPDVVIRKCDIRGDVVDPGAQVRKRSIGVAGENTKISLLIEDSIIRGGGTQKGGAVILFMTGEEGGKSVINIRRSAIYSPRQIALCLYQGARIQVDHCDIVANDEPCIFYSNVPSILVSGDIAVTNCNIISLGKSGKPTGGGMPKSYVYHHNNTSDPGFIGIVEMGDLRYGNKDILTGDAEGSAIGTNRNFANILKK